MRDEFIPIAQAERLVAALTVSEVEVEFIAIDSVYHNWTTQIEVPPGNERECDLEPLALPFSQKYLQPENRP